MNKSETVRKGLCGNIIKVSETAMKSARRDDLEAKGIPVYDPAKPEDARLMDLKTKVKSYNNDYHCLLALGNLPEVDIIAQRLDEIASQIDWFGN